MEQDRLSTLLECFRVRYHTEPTHIVVTGTRRTGGNHTDHNGARYYPQPSTSICWLVTARR